MKKKHLIIIIMLAALGFVNSCSDDFLEITPNGSLDQLVLLSEKGCDNLLIGAYSLLDGVSNQFGFDQWDGASTNWLWGSVRGLEANKGSDAGDQPDMNPIQTFSETATNNKINSKWRVLYEGIARCNSVIRTATLTLEAGAIDEPTFNKFVNQARALRGHYHFEAWRMWEKIPYVDETTDPLTVTNSEDVTDKIIADLTAGTSLDLNMGAVGRFNKTVSQVILAKALMQMDNNYDAALPLLMDAATNGKKANGDAIGLAPTYGEIFDVENRNGIEAVYTVQYSVNDGSGGSNAGGGEVLNFPYKGSGGSPGGCCGFFIPNQELVNTFRTASGLPLPNFTYNQGANTVKNDFGLTPAQAFTEDDGELDPRLDWTVGRRGIPYWDWGVHTGSDWVRDPTYSGPYSPKKQVFKKEQEGTFTEVGNWTSGWTSNGYRMIRYADILLMIAECNILKSAPDLGAATDYINMVRARAKNPDGFVVEDETTTPAANYVIEEYPADFATVEEAFYALHTERKLELGLEGHRYFDVKRWGNSFAVTELNRVLNYQKTLQWGTSLYGTATVGAEDVTYPIPQRQIDLSSGALVQNR